MPENITKGLESDRSKYDEYHAADGDRRFRGLVPDNPRQRTGEHEEHNQGKQQVWNYPVTVTATELNPSLQRLGDTLRCGRQAKRDSSPAVRRVSPFVGDIAVLRQLQ